MRFGLWLYDNYARDPTLPKHESHAADDPDVIPVDADEFPWVCSFSDAQIVYPERFTLALLQDARHIAAERGTEFEVLTYHTAEIEGKTVRIRRIANQEVVCQIEPAAVVNATGAWVDQTLKSIGVPSKQLMGGTKGSHFFTSHSRLQQLLAGRAIYTEAGDGRPIFILPFVNGTLVGTTDEPFEGDPGTAVATPRELAYLVNAVNDVFRDLNLTVSDIDMHYAGVRPLPYSDASTPGAISRRHWIEPNTNAEVPLFSIIGGKLTTCRSLAEDSAAAILQRIGIKQTGDSRERPIVDRDPIFTNGSSTSSTGTRQTLIGTRIALDVVRQIIREQWVTTLDDLVERRLMLLYHPNLERKTLVELAELLIEAGLLNSAQKEEAVTSVIGRLEAHFGKRVIP